jgi:hypothetical protein
MIPQGRIHWYWFALVLHRSVEDRNGGEGEFSIHGRVSLVSDPAQRAALFESAWAGRIIAVLPVYFTLF